VSRDLDIVRSVNFFHGSCCVWSVDLLSKWVVFGFSVNGSWVTTDCKRVNP
jgi:hypothetical protein